MDILWSGALLVPLIVNCATARPRKLDSSGLAAWVALAALVHRYSRAAETALDQDLKACRSNDPIGALLSNLRQHRSSLLADPSDFTGALADRSGLLALFVACKNRGIEDFFTGAKVLLQGQIEKHHILPRAQFTETSRATADNIANIAFISGDVNKSIGLSGPEVYLKQIQRRALESQCVDTSLWSIERCEEFWAARRVLLADSFNEFVKDALPGRKLGAA